MKRVKLHTLANIAANRYQTVLKVANNKFATKFRETLEPFVY
jgi:hypothetical protein